VSVVELALRHRQGDRNRDRLKSIIAEKSVKRGEFELASGGVSDLYFEMKETLLDPEGLHLAAGMILEVASRFPSVSAVGGLELGACPIVSAVANESWPSRPLAGFYVRKERKTRGAKQLIDGPVGRGTDVLILDDVTTKGGSVLQAVEAVRNELGCNVRGVVTVVDRQQGAEAMLKEHGLDLIPLFVMSEF